MNFYQYWTKKIGIFFLIFFTLSILSVGASSLSDADDNASSYLITSSPAVVSGDWDIDGDGRADALTDGLLFLRYAFGLTGDALISGVIASDGQYTTASDIEQELATVYHSSGDIDGNGSVDALSDGLLVLRYLFGLDGDTLTAGVIGSGATVTDSAALEAYLGTLMPQAPYIILNGSVTINHEQATSYVDASATATDFIDGSVAVTTAGLVDSDRAGIYTLSYSATDREGNVSRVLTRTVTVADTITPVITLVGDATLDVEQDSSYTDAGATAVDAVDGSITVVTNGSVNTATPGSYTLTYTATDNAGNEATDSRTVNVTSSKIVLKVFTDEGVDAGWDGGIQVADSGKSWSNCAINDISECNIEWQLVNDQGRGTVLQIEHSSAGQQAILYFKASMGKDLSGYAGGQIVFDIKTISGDSNYSMKVDCVYPCTAADQNLGIHGDNGWESVTIEINDLVAQGLLLSTVDTGIVIWATQYTDTVFQLDNVRWEDTDGSEAPEEPASDDGWIIPAYTGYTTPESYEGYSLTWSDEFSATDINTDYWGFDIGGDGWGNDELQYYTNRNAYLKKGMLVIRAQQESYGGRSYTSARLKTQGKQNFQYGRIDIRARMPEGQGIWPALWMLGKNINEVSWPYCGEVDIMEMVGGGSGKDNRVVGTAHWNVGGLNTSYSPASFGSPKLMPENLSNNFHVYSIVWDSNKIKWYIDDVQYHIMSIDNSASLEAFQKEFFLIFNLAVGGKWPGNPNTSTVFPQRLLVDYVRVFQDENSNTGGQSGPTHPVPGLLEAEDYTDMSGIQIETTTDTGGGSNVGYVDTGDWLEFSLDVADEGSYLIEYRVASKVGSNGFQTLIDGTPIDTQAVENTGGWQSWTTNSAIVNLNAGEQTLRLNAIGNEWNLNWINFTVHQESVSKPVNSSKWFHQTQLPNGNSWYNGEQQHYTDRLENASVANGILSITAKKESFEDQGVTKQYTSARLNSKFAFTYGRVEVKAKIPKGQGTWPAIWMLSKDINEPGAYFAEDFGTTSWPDGGEIDILEHWGGNPNYAQSAIHTRSSFGGTINHGGQSIPTMTSDFHVYSLDWSADKMVFKVDGLEHYTYKPETKNNDTWPFDRDQYLLLNFAIEGSIYQGFEEDNLNVDFVRIYDENNNLIWSDEFN